MSDGDERDKERKGKGKEERITRGNQKAMPLHLCDVSAAQCIIFTAPHCFGIGCIDACGASLNLESL